MHYSLIVIKLIYKMTELFENIYFAQVNITCYEVCLENNRPLSAFVINGVTVNELIVISLQLWFLFANIFPTSSTVWRSDDSLNVSDPWFSESECHQLRSGTFLIENLFSSKQTELLMPRINFKAALQTCSKSILLYITEGVCIFNININSIQFQLM